MPLVEIKGLISAIVIIDVQMVIAKKNQDKYVMELMRNVTQTTVNIAIHLAVIDTVPNLF